LVWGCTTPILCHIVDADIRMTHVMCNIFPRYTKPTCSETASEVLCTSSTFVPLCKCIFESALNSLKALGDTSTSTFNTYLATVHIHTPAYHKSTMANQCAHAPPLWALAHEVGLDAQHNHNCFYIMGPSRLDLTLNTYHHSIMLNVRSMPCIL
jgi:hypothetical protein